MMRTVFTSEKFVVDMVSRLMKRYDHILVERNKPEQLVWRIVATSLRSGLEEDDFGRANPVIFTGFSNPPPNCS
jgi:1-acyl-sn-glycerol-3-phosphate acyltransferase